MPIYAYKCSNCGFAKDVLQKMSDPLLTVCPSCGESTFSKQVTAAGFQLKGSGWYVTDFREGGGKKGGEGGDKSSSDKPAEKSSEKSSEKSGDSATPAAAAPAPAASKAADKPASAPAPAPAAPSSSSGGGN
jgi:putative FmdB family regulatory protein